MKIGNAQLYPGLRGKTLHWAGQQALKDLDPVIRKGLKRIARRGARRVDVSWEAITWEVPVGSPQPAPRLAMATVENGEVVTYPLQP